VTFRVKDKIFAMTGPEGGGVTIRTTVDQQAELVDTFPDLVRPASYVGRFGWVVVEMDAFDDALLRDLLVGAWRRTATKAVVRAWEEGRS
jgi:predicted DNA-binding protein (MmcQ/YjbR family)